MTDEEIEQYGQRLIEIQRKQEASVRVNELQGLAKELGASTLRMVDTIDDRPTTQGFLPQNVITEIEIVSNIHSALQTATMINMSKTSASMCEIASRNYKIALVAAVAALLSALAAWFAVLAR